jgi:hypothetical protein
VERVNLASFSRMIEQIDPEVKVFLPDVLRNYDLRHCMPEAQTR